MKSGRGRHYPEPGTAASELAYLFELHARAADLIEDIEPATQMQELHGHSIAALWTHLIDAEVGRMCVVSGQATEDITSLADLEELTTTVAAGRQLEDATGIPQLPSWGQVLRHLQWHWTYHAAQIGLLRRALDKPYKWTFADHAAS